MPADVLDRLIMEEVLHARVNLSPEQIGEIRHFVESGSRSGEYPEAKATDFQNIRDLRMRVCSGIRVVANIQ